MDKDGKVQPLYTTIDLDFNIVGPFGGFASDSSNRGVALSTDDGGIYQPFVEWVDPSLAAIDASLRSFNNPG